MQKTIFIRDASPEDAERIAALSHQLGYPSEAVAMRKRIESILQLSDHKILVAVGKDGGVVGWAHCGVQLHLESGLFPELVGLVVDERHRGSGTGKMLVEAIEAWVRERGFGTLTVRTNVVRTGTHKFYERLDFLVLKQQVVYRKNVN